MKNKTLFQSIKCAIRGLIKGIKREKNFRIYIIHVLITLPLNLYLKFSLTEMILYLICVCGVFAAESINTAVEIVCDFITKKFSEDIKYAKDIAASGVMLWGAIFYIAELTLLGVHLFA